MIRQVWEPQKYLSMYGKERSVRAPRRRQGKGKEKSDIPGERKHVAYPQGAEEVSLVAQSL